jgi:hypothetical protein
MCRKPGIYGNRKIMKPELGLFVFRSNMYVGWLVPFIGVEESAIRAPA